jgi:hypothetical protein
MRRYAKIIEDKSTKNCGTSSKTATWAKVCAEYNAQCETRPRLGRQLKVLYDNLKRSTRKTVTEKHVSYTCGFVCTYEFWFYNYVNSSNANMKRN